MTRTGLPKAPAHLSPASKRQWDAIVAEYTLDPRHELLLRQALEQADRAEQARLAVARDGMTVTGRFSPQPHPGIKIERDALITGSRLWRQLDLDKIDAEAERRLRPVSLRSAR